MSFSLTQSDNQLESRLLDSDWNTPTVDTGRLPGGGLDPYRALAVERITNAADRLFGRELGSDALWDSPAVEQLALAFAADSVAWLRAGTAPVQPAQATGLDGQIAMSSSGGGSSGGSSGGWNTPPQAQNDYYDTPHNVTLSVPPSGVIWNDYDPDGDPITAHLDSGPAHAAAFALFSDGSFNYMPVPDWAGLDGFTYHVNDGQADSNTVDVTVTVRNSPPMAHGDYYNTMHDVTISESAPGVMWNDYDTDATDTITAHLDTGPDHAAAFNLSGDGSFSYTPPSNWAGTDDFTYHVSDVICDSETVTVAITVGNDAPLVGDDGPYPDG